MKESVLRGTQVLKVPDGHTWADSDLLCTALDTLPFGTLLANCG